MSDPGRRTRMLQLAAGAAFLAVAAVLVLIVISASGSDDGGDTELEGVAEINRSLQGIPQHELILGDLKAPVELVEYADLQCPYCKAFTEDIVPSIIENQVKKGQAVIGFRNFVVIGKQSVAAGAAALAAGFQERGWNFIEIFYRNQGRENSGYADDAFLEAIAKAAGVKDLRLWNQNRAEQVVPVEQTTAEAEGLGFTGTPSFALGGLHIPGLEAIETPASAGPLEEAIEDASH